MPTHVSEAERGQARPSADDRSASHLVVVLIFILLALGLLIHDGLLGLVGATTRAGRLRNECRITSISQRGAEARYWAAAFTIACREHKAQSPITFLIKGAIQGVRSAAQLAAGRPPALWGNEKACEVHLLLNLIPKSVLFRFTLAVRDDPERFVAGYP